ncbi:MAG: hypothetical protein ACLSAF_16360 [Intestinimonas sp.]
MKRSVFHAGLGALGGVHCPHSGLMPSGASGYATVAEGYAVKRLGYLRLDGGMRPICSFRFFSIKKKVDLNPKTKALLAMCGIALLSSPH